MLAVHEGQTHFDTVLLDLKMPDSNDLGLLAKLRALQPRARLILMTAFGTPETQSEALAIGAWRVVHKPFDIKSVAAMIVDSHRATATD